MAIIGEVPSSFVKATVAHRSDTLAAKQAAQKLLPVALNSTPAARPDVDETPAKPAKGKSKAQPFVAAESAPE